MPPKAPPQTDVRVHGLRGEALPSDVRGDGSRGGALPSLLRERRAEAAGVSLRLEAAGVSLCRLCHRSTGSPSQRLQESPSMCVIMVLS